MARSVVFNYRKGSGAGSEILYGTVEIKPTIMHGVGMSAVLPVATKADLINGTVTIPNVAASPAPVSGQVDWAYQVTVKDRFGKQFEWLVGVPDGVPPINFIDLPRYFETKPPLFGEGPRGVPGEGATITVGTVASGPTPTITNVGTSTNAKLNFVLPKGDKGDIGAGVPSGGTALQMVRKNAANTSTEWATVDKTLVGLGSVDNTSDVNKPVSTAQKTYIDQSNTLAYKAKNSAEGPGTYPVGVTVFLGATADGWPDVTGTGALFASIQTVKVRGYDSATQYASVYTTTTAGVDEAPLMYRTGVTTGVWGNWQTIATSAEVTRLGLNTPKNYGAVGDGVTDDTVALQLWADSPLATKELTSGRYSITASIKVASDDAKLTGTGGVLVASTVGMTMVEVTGNNVTIDGLILDGKNTAYTGIQAVKNYVTLTNNEIFDLYGERVNVSGVKLVDMYSGYNVRGNYIHNLEAVGLPEDIGSGRGSSRAIYVTSGNYVSPPTAEGYLTANTIRKIIGLEGDAIQVIYMPGYSSGRANILDNTIEDFSRRGVKLQASSCRVIGNTLTSDEVSGVYTHPSTGIDSQYAYDNTVKRNTIRVSAGFSGITTVGSGESSPSEKFGVFIEGNTIYGSGITYRNLTNGAVKNNTLYDCIAAWCIYSTNAKGSVISENTIYALPNASADSAFIYINGSGGLAGNLIENNKIMSGERISLITCHESGSIVKNNVSLAVNGGVYQGNGVKSVGTVWEGNTARSSSAAFAGYSFDQIHKGFVNSRAGSYIPNVYFSTTDPTGNGRYHTKGDIYFDFGSQAVTGGKVGWICTTAGSPTVPGTFVRFGTIG